MRREGGGRKGVEKKQGPFGENARKKGKLEISLFLPPFKRGEKLEWKGFSRVARERKKRVGRGFLANCNISPFERLSLIMQRSEGGGRLLLRGFAKMGE